MGGPGCEVSTLPHLQHTAVTNNTMAGHGGRERGRERERVSFYLDNAGILLKEVT